jgi:hypothetical protein
MSGGDSDDDVPTIIVTEIQIKKTHTIINDRIFVRDASLETPAVIQFQ